MRIGIFPAKSRQRLHDRLAADEWHQASGDELPGPVLVRLATSSDGRLIVTGLIIGATRDDEISSRDLRRISLPSIVVAFIGSKRARLRLADPLLWADETEQRDVPELPGRRGYEREHFEAVAVAYRRALVERPRDPVRRVAEVFADERGPRPEPTVRRWVQRARDLGLLGESIPGKAGERRRRRRP